MHNPTSVISRAAHLIGSRGHASAKATKSTNPWVSGSLTLHSAVRISCDMDPGDSVFAYWQWREIRELLDVVWSSIDDRVAQVSGEILPSIVWANQDNRSTDEVVELLHGVNASTTPEIESITRRPRRNPKFVSGGTMSPSRSSFLLGDGTLQTSLMLSIVVAKEQLDLSFGDLFSDLSKLQMDNESLLAHVDDLTLKSIVDIGAVTDPVSLVIARLLVSAISAQSDLLERETDRTTSLRVCEFFAVTEDSANWSGLSDTAVLDRLLRISGDLESASRHQAMPEALLKEISKLRNVWNAS